ncbi:MAG: MerR family transcriptional regulator [Spirochaetes bacterium]|jgi:methylmalonyl-CoA mutase cobalamin-binding subunit|nr:MerR family transcriptional regulator [Spirochaetota bacterium]
MDYPIQVAAKRTGLTASTLRAWERRYDGVKPDRDQAGRRRYPEELVEKLSLLSSLVQQGYRISEIAPLSLADLRTCYGRVTELPGEAYSAVFSSPEAPSTSPSPTDAVVSPKASVYIDSAIEAVKSLDDVTLQRVFEEAMLVFGRLDIVDEFLFPLLHRVQDKVTSGDFKQVQVSMLRTTMRSAVASLYTPSEDDTLRPKVVIGAPISQHDDMGLVASAVHCYAAGWHPVVLGSGVPAEEIVEAASSLEAAAVVLSVVSSRYDLAAWEELTRARRAVGSEIPVYFGGRMPKRLVDDLAEAGLHYLEDMTEMRSALSAQPTPR